MIEVNSKYDCCGCGACMNICPQNCIDMKADEEGFNYPVVDVDRCIKCNKCTSVCPIINVHTQKKNNAQKGYLVQHIDKKTRIESTSGGFFSALAEYVIEQGGIVCGAILDENFYTKHVLIDDLSKIELFRNSKYVQSDLLKCYSEIETHLNNNRIVCFSGTPCQVEGLLGYLDKEYKNLILVDLVCRAVPSPGIWKKWIDMYKQNEGGIESVRFRDKKLGYQYSTMVLTTTTGKEIRSGIESNSWLRMFFSGMIIRPSCSECKFRGRYRRSDFTIWDCLNVSILNKTLDENTGVTRVLSHTKKAEMILEELRDNLSIVSIDADLITKNVEEMVNSPSINKRRNDFMDDYNRIEFPELINKYYPRSIKIVVKDSVRRLLNIIGFDIPIKHLLLRLNTVFSKQRGA